MSILLASPERTCNSLVSLSAWGKISDRVTMPMVECSTSEKCCHVMPVCGRACLLVHVCMHECKNCLSGEVKHGDREKTGERLRRSCRDAPLEKGDV